MCWLVKMLRASWTGWCRRTRRSCGRISIRRGHLVPGAGGARPNDKIHALADAGIRPVALLLSAGQAGDNPRLVPLLEALSQSGHRPAYLLADKAYSHPSTRRELRRRRIRHTIPERSDQAQRRRDQGSGGGRPPKFDAELYKQRNTIERGFGRFKQWRGIATRYDKYARTYHGGVLLAATLILARP